VIKDFIPGSMITGFFMLRRKELGKKHSSNEPYLSIELTDASGRIFGSVWENAAELYTILTEGGTVKIRALVTEFKDRLHLSIIKIRPAIESDAVDLDVFVPEIESGKKEIELGIFAMVESITDAYLRKLAELFFHDNEFLQQFFKSPGGKLAHHCYRYGLAEHTLFVAKIALAVSDLYQNLNRSLLIAGALLHDIGKILEYNTRGYIEFSDRGRLHGHVAIGYQMVAERLKQLTDFPMPTADQLLHLILAHQGELEHGSPVLPMTPEAFVLYYADEIDSKLNALDRIIRSEKIPESNWSKYVNILNRFIYIEDKT
jgi:3'-5' exoribonuclease